MCVIISGELKVIGRHFRIVHAFKTTHCSPIPLICTANNCYRSFKSWNAFRKHPLACESLIRFQNQIAFVNDSNIGNAILSSLDDTIRL